ncbi:MAG: fumarylacetoacetate hydrolase family protein [Bacteroidetes bacterium]|nr:fumarylacetoacetate hydrolase family protein [Bacteroidota bacterium]MBS1630585.1 fumarylacetoacetate hydrolase family protein [Bacteroidota bacterium]
MKIICVGRNYSEHAKELGNAIPEVPILFMKARNALLQPERAFYYPEFSKDIHYEAELVIRICKNGKHIAEKFAHRYYDQCSIGIDFTARDLQQQQKAKGLPWEIAKAFDSSAAVGTFVPIPAEKGVQDLGFELSKNGSIVQHGYTGDMLHSVHQIIAYSSTFFSLNTGDLLFTGTPSGVGPIAVGDVLEGWLEGEKLLHLDIR